MDMDQFLLAGPTMDLQLPKHNDLQEVEKIPQVTTNVTSPLKSDRKYCLAREL